MRYEAPTTSSEAAALLAAASGEAFVLAGGTDLLVRMKTMMVDPELVVDVKRIGVMGSIQASDDGGFRIGAAVPGVEIGEHEALGRAWPGIVEAVQLIGSDQIQGRCTIAGNICNASPAADTTPALIAADAQVVIVGPNGQRTLPVAELATGPGRTSLTKGELVEAILLPPRPPHSGDAYLRFTPRTEMDIAVVGAGVSVTLSDGVVSAARVALGAVAPTVIAVEPAAAALVGSRLDDGALDALVAACRAACKPIDDKRGTAEYRTEVAGVLAKRAAMIAFERAGGSR